MDGLRIVLFLGLVFHKGLWEILKRRDGESRVRGDASKGRGRWVIKTTKAIILVFLILQTLFLNVFPISHDGTTLRIIGTAIFFLGLGTAVIGRIELGKNWADLEDYRVMSEQSLVTSGIYGYIRHPIYTGDILLLIGLEMALNSWLVLAVAIPLLFVVRQVLAEEALLSQRLPGYDAYCRQTKMFIPFVL